MNIPTSLIFPSCTHETLTLTNVIKISTISIPNSPRGGVVVGGGVGTPVNIKGSVVYIAWLVLDKNIPENNVVFAVKVTLEVWPILQSSNMPITDNRNQPLHSIIYQFSLSSVMYLIYFYKFI